jgi:hypothetical protein
MYPRPSITVTERVTASVVTDDRWYVVDVCNDGGFDSTGENPWYVCVDELVGVGNGDFADAKNDLVALQGAHCEGSLDVCNGETLLDYWVNEVAAS